MVEPGKPSGGVVDHGASEDPEFSSLFDAMLKKDRARLERLYSGSLPKTDRPAEAVEPAPSRPVMPPRPDVRAAERRKPTEPTRSRPEISGSADGIPFSFRPSE
jgi:hypothetical protein